MVASNSQKILPTNELLKTVRAALTDVAFIPGERFMWSPRDRRITYVPEELSEANGQWSLLHELAHANLRHSTYTTDFELLKLEVEAWHKAASMAALMGLQIDQNYIEDCTDTYRDWLHKRSTCPTCGTVGIQHSEREYRCHNCMSHWTVSQSRFCRAYRKKRPSNKEKKSSENSRTTFS